jgi:acyl carrier protein
VITRESILDAVYVAVDRVNETLAKDRRLAKAPETRLIGIGGRLDSLGAVNLIVETELAVEERLGVMIDLGDERAARQQVHPLETIATLAEYIHSLLA